MPKIEYVEFGTRVKVKDGLEYIGELIDQNNLKSDAPKPRTPFDFGIFILLDKPIPSYTWSPYCKISPGTEVEILEKRVVVAQEIKEPEVHRNACPRCGNIGHWVSLILKCENCFHTW